FVIGKAKTLAGQVATKNVHARVQVFGKFGKLEVELQRSPEAFAGFLFRFRTNEEIELVAGPGEYSRNKVTAQVAGGAGDEDRHKGSEGVAASVSEVPCGASAAQSSARAPRDAGGPPS